jgi:hypothetical protein
MSLARRLVPGRAHAISRTVAQRALFLRPIPEVKAIVGFGVGRGLVRAPGLTVLAYMTNTNHVQGVFLDQGRLAGLDAVELGTGKLERPSALPAAMDCMHALQARALNTHFGMGGSLWSSGSYSNVEIHDQASLDDQMLYVWIQPVKDGLVERADLWPGFKIMPEDLGRTITVPRPEGAFFGGRRPGHVKPGDATARAEMLRRLAREEREAEELARQRHREAGRRRGRTSKRQQKLDEDRERRRLRAKARRELEREGKPVRDRSSLPAFVTFTVGVPPGYEDWPIEEVRAHFRRRLTALEEEVHREFAKTGRRFMGLKRILAQRPDKTAGDNWPTFAINPRVACKDPKHRADVLKGLRAWRTEMQQKRSDWATGKRQVVFPRGAYGMWRFHGALVEGGHRPGAEFADPKAHDAPT